MKRYGVARNDGLAVMLTEEQHVLTRTFKGRAKKIPASSTAHSELAADIWDVRSILRKEGIYTKEINRNLMKGVADFQGKYPEIFKKVKKQ